MRLPLRHPPPGSDAPRRRCAHLEALAEALVGVPLGPAAAFTSSARSRGRHGNALQWHLGLAAHDNEGAPDWEGRIEIKLVSVWLRPGGQIGCDKLKVCDVAIDPWAKLANVLWVFADRTTRIVVGCRIWSLQGEPRERLESSWRADPHFGEPPLFVEAREQRGSDGVVKRAPAYYLAARWLAEAGLLPPAMGILPFDQRWWRDVRAEHGRDPVTHVATAPQRQPCRRCHGPLQWEQASLERDGWAPARHGMPHGGDCGIRAHLVVSPQRLIVPTCLTPRELLAAIEDREPPGSIWRLSDHVPEPSDHEH